MLECKGVGEGLVYSWYKDRKPLLLGQKLGQLEMRSVSVDDRGDYYCQVANDGGWVDSSHTIVTVGEWWVEPLVLVAAVVSHSNPPLSSQLPLSTLQSSLRMLKGRSAMTSLSGAVL